MSSCCPHLPCVPFYLHPTQSTNYTIPYFTITDSSSSDSFITRTTLPHTLWFNVTDNGTWCHLNYTRFTRAIQEIETLRSMRSKCDGQRKSLTVQLNSRPVRRIELIRKYCIISLLAFLVVCLDIISEWPPLSYRLSWFWWIES